MGDGKTGEKKNYTSAGGSKNQTDELMASLSGTSAKVDCRRPKTLPILNT